MLRLNYLHMREGLLAKGDECTCVDESYATMDSDARANVWNEDDEDNSRCHIQSFALRDNDGTQPVPDDFPVVIDWGNNIERHKASGVYWSFDDDYPIKSWKPDIDKLLEQQNGYDKQQEKPIEEIILDAKSGLTRHDLMGDKAMTQQQENMREFASWLLAEIEDSMTIGDNISSLYDKFLNHKKLESELEIAKEKQITQLACKYSVVHSELELQNLFSKMQRLGDLAEIILPLKEV